jgi:hypothetical protein
MAQRLLETHRSWGHPTHQLTDDPRVRKIALSNVRVLDQGFHSKQIYELTDAEQTEGEQVKDARSVFAEIDPVDSSEAHEHEAPQGIAQPFSVGPITGL